MQGYQRYIPTPHPEAVVWWYVRTFDNGFVYARGGYVATTREARKKIRDAYDDASRQHERVSDRPTHRLGADGELEQVDYGPYGAVRA